MIENLSRSWNAQKKGRFRTNAFLHQQNTFLIVATFFTFQYLVILFRLDFGHVGL